MPGQEGTNNDSNIEKKKQTKVYPKASDAHNGGTYRRVKPALSLNDDFAYSALLCFDISVCKLADAAWLAPAIGSLNITAIAFSNDSISCIS